MDNVLIMDKLDDLSARFDNKIGQIETKLDGVGQDTELLVGQQDYKFVAQAISYPAYMVCNSALGENIVDAGSSNMTGWEYLYKFKSKLKGEVRVLFRGTTSKATERLSAANYVIRNLTNGSNVLDLKLYVNYNSNTNTFSYENNITLLENNEYTITIKNTNSSYSQEVNITVCNIYATTEVTTKTISNQIVEIN